MQLGLGLLNFGSWFADWQQLIAAARAADDAGVDRIVLSDHVLLGENLDAYAWGRFPTGPDAPWLEPLTVATAIAAATSRIRLATGILIAPLRPAPLLAKTVATLDVLSNGRVDLGVGVGWQREEYAALGVDFDGRGARLDETIAACRILWEQMPASYDGTAISFSGIYCSPPPVQRPLPVWFSGTLNARNLRRVVELGNGWIPIMGATLDDIRAGATQLRDKAGRPIDVQAPLPPVKSGEGGLDIAATMAQLPDLADAGVTNVYLNIASLAPDATSATALLPALVDAFRSAAP